MLIANPIYDVVFKYLFEDNKIAKIFISAIIGEEIIDLDFQPQEHTTTIDSSLNVRGKHSFTVYRLDFKAKIKQSDGSYKLVIIEIQKAKMTIDILRFRKYLGEQYSNPENIYEINGKKKPLPIVNIYFLGDGLGSQNNSPVIKSNREIIDLVTGEKIGFKSDFIDALSHDTYIVSIPNLVQKRRNELEMILSVFDQKNITTDKHILNVKEEDFPERYRNIIRRLQKAQETKQIRKTMDVEDEILSELALIEREIGKLEHIVIEKDKTIEQKDKEIEAQKRIIEELQRKIKE